MTQEKMYQGISPGWITRIEDYIENHLDENLNVDKLASIAGYSKYHFIRRFRDETGETLHEFIKRIRLEKAFFLLSTSDDTITEISFKVGYANQASFAKAFKKTFGVPASNIKKNSAFIKKKNSNNGKVFYDNLVYYRPYEMSVDKLEDFTVMYVRNKGEYKGDKELFEYLFNKLYQFALEKTLLNANSRWLVVYHDYTNQTMDKKLRMSVCVTVDREVLNYDEDFGTMNLKGGLYAIGRFNLLPKEYQYAWNYMCMKWLPESNYRPDERMPFEHYLENTDENFEGERVEICIPIIRK